VVFIAPEHLYHLKVFHSSFPSREQYASLFYNLADREGRVEEAVQAGAAEVSVAKEGLV